jgi:hypothetical protein
MVLTPALRGLFGLETDALHHVLRVHPQLPAAWETATLRNVPIGGTQRADLHFHKQGGKLLIEATTSTAQPLCLTNGTGECPTTTAAVHRLELNLPPFEVNLPPTLPTPGARTASPKIVLQSDFGFEIEGNGGSSVALDVRFAHAPTRIDGATLANGKLTVHFPPGSGYQPAAVRFHW